MGGGVELMKAIIAVDVPDWQIGEEVLLYFPDTMTTRSKAIGLNELIHEVGSLPTIPGADGIDYVPMYDVLRKIKEYFGET